MPLYDSPRLKQGLSIRKLLTTGVEELVLDEDDIAFQEVPTSERYVDTAYEFEEYKDHMNYEVVDLSLAETTFECIGVNMTSVTPDGKVKKKVLVPGTNPVPEDATVYVNYDFYLELQEVPLDSSHLRLGKPERLQLGQNSHIAGFDIAVSSMAIGEKSQFLFHYDYAFGKMGSPPRIPAESSILAVIQVCGVAERRQVLGEEENPAEEMNSYAAIAARAASELRMANDYFNRKQKVATAVYYYKSAERMLAHSSCSNQEDEKQRREQLFKIYRNLAVCYNHASLNEPSKALFVLERALNVDRELAMKNAKFFYLRGVARATKGEYELALKDLKKAAFIEPKNEEVVKKLRWLDEKVEISLEKEREMSARALGMDNNAAKTDVETLAVGGLAVYGNDKLKDVNKNDLSLSKALAESKNVDDSTEEEEDSDEDGSEEDEVVKFLENFKKSTSAQRHLGYSLTAAQRQFYREQCVRLGLVYKEVYAGPLRKEITISKH